MKVVLFCGGLGTRLRDFSEAIPKPLAPIGYRPILWHVMKYYAHYGHKDFILCLGYKADLIKNYFLNYNECISNDFTLTNGGQNLKLLNTDTHDWNITFVDTGLYSNIGQRLKLVQKHLENQEMFLANYSDGLTDLVLTEAVEKFYSTDKIASFLSVRPSQTFHLIYTQPNGIVTQIKDVNEANLRSNGGYFIFKNEIFDYFDYINEKEELVHEPFQRLISIKQLFAYEYNGFWACMDTFKEKQPLEDMFSLGNAPWEIWKHNKKLTTVNLS